MAPSSHNMASADLHSKRDEFVRYDSFWWTPTGYIVKWSIMAGIFLVIFVWFIGGYLHAQRRMKKGLPPMKYHRFLISKHQRAQFEPQTRQWAMHPTSGTGPEAGMYGQTYQTQNPDGTYSVHTYYPEPPPMYNNNGGPPGYSPDQKEELARQQSLGQTAPLPGVQQGFAPPPGPPPGVHTGLPEGQNGASPGVQQGQSHAQSGQQDPASGLKLPQVALNKIKAFKDKRPF